MVETTQAEEISARDGNTWVRLPLATLNGLLDERFKKLENESLQLRAELAQTHAALASVQTGLVRMSTELQQQHALGTEQLRNEIKQITAALAGLKDGATVTLRTQEVTFSPKQTASPPTEIPLELPAGAMVIDSSAMPPPMPRATSAPGPTVPFRKPTYASPPPPPSQAGRAGVPHSTPAHTGPVAPRASFPSASTAPLPASAAKVRSLSDRLLKMLGVTVPGA